MAIRAQLRGFDCETDRFSTQPPFVCRHSGLRPARRQTARGQQVLRVAQARAEELVPVPPGPDALHKDRAPIGSGPAQRQWSPEVGSARWIRARRAATSDKCRWLDRVALQLPPGPARRRQPLGRRNTALDRDDRAIDRIAQWVPRRVPEQRRGALATLEEHWTYLVNNNDRMRYATLRRVGLPCGSGATEGACKSVVTMRAKGSGQRWHDDGVTAALTLRAIYLSERLPTLWSHFAAEYSADVRAAA